MNSPHLLILSLINSPFWNNIYPDSTHLLHIKNKQIDISHLFHTLSFYKHNSIWDEFWLHVHYNRHQFIPNLSHKNLGIKRYTFQMSPTRFFSPIILF